MTPAAQACCPSVLQRDPDRQPKPKPELPRGARAGNVHGIAQRGHPRNVSPKRAEFRSGLMLLELEFARASVLTSWKPAIVHPITSIGAVSLFFAVLMTAPDDRRDYMPIGESKKE